MNSTTIPGLRYQHAKKAMTWLHDAFGFEVFLEVPGEGERIEHARLTLGPNMIMLASLDRDSEFDQKFVTPSTAKGVTQSILIVVDDPDAIYGKARAAGATIIDDIADFEFGGRTFSCEDLERHLWVFTSHDPWKTSDE